MARDTPLAICPVAGWKIVKHLLRTCFAQLADNPQLGRRAEQLSTGLRRYEHRSRVVFYQKPGDQTLFVRVLRYRRDVTRYF